MSEGRQDREEKKLKEKRRKIPEVIRKQHAQYP
jgi:hypothetical protein